MSVSIKVAIRCRPFSCADKLGVTLMQEEKGGHITLVNSSYSTTHFSFNWAWWSAYNHAKFVDSNGAQEVQAKACEDMKMINQTDVYADCGSGILDDLLSGDTCVMFAYGLSGSGKTYTVFGPDAADIPEAWFKHQEPHDLWGIFPRLGYDLFKRREADPAKDNWKITMKYFQNVVDIVRDLMNPIAEERTYKSGMRKDKDGFMDVTWAQSCVLKDWPMLCQTFKDANKRKAIAATQFNHQSTRGHCIMVLEVEKLVDGDKNKKQKGRLYVCDLAGTEPAGDIVAARYKKTVESDGEIVYTYLGPEDNKKKTQDLQNQGKKINLSLSEMAQFFMKMAKAVKKKTLKAGKSIPGCNSYFLCKFLKDTMLQAKTYLFCAIRPEAKFHQYTFSTLGFAKNASVIKLKPKKATVQMTAAEKKLTQELEKMKAQLAAGGGGGGSKGEIDKLNAMLEEKKKEMEALMSGGAAQQAQDDKMQKQRKDYQKRGIDMTYFYQEADLKDPYLLNIDADEFRNERFMYLLKKDVTIFGPGCDVQPMSLGVEKGHCKIIKGKNKIELEGGKGMTFVNGAKVTDGKKVSLKVYDRVIIANDIMMLRWPGKEDEKALANKMDPSTCVGEYHKAQAAAMSDQQQKLAKEMEAKMRKQFEAELAKLKKEGNANQEDIEKKARQMAVVDKEMQDLFPLVENMKNICKMLHREVLDFQVTLQTDPESQNTIVMVQVVYKGTSDTVMLDPGAFKRAQTLFRSELRKIKSSLEDGEDYQVPHEHDPVIYLYSCDFHFASAYCMCLEYLKFGLSVCETFDVNSAALIRGKGLAKVGKLSLKWTPIDPAVEDDDDSNPEFEYEYEDPDRDWVGNAWVFRLDVDFVEFDEMQVDRAYCQYTFNGELFTVDCIENPDNKFKPEFNYSQVHRVEEVTTQFLQTLMQPLNVHIYVSPALPDHMIPKDKLGTDNDQVAKKLGIPLSATQTKEGLRLRIVELDGLLKVEKKKNTALEGQLKLAMGGNLDEAWKSREMELLKECDRIEREFTLYKEAAQKTMSRQKSRVVDSLVQDKKHNSKVG